MTITPPKCRNPNHPREGSSIKVEPIRDPEDIQKLKDLLMNDPRNYCIFALGINTAYRAKELVSITVGQVAHLQVGDRLDVKQSKNGKYRSVAINHTAYHAIQSLLRVHPCPKPNAPLLYSKTTHRPLKSNTLSRYIKQWCKMINLHGNYGSHSMRKTWGYHIYQRHSILGQDNSDKRLKIAELMIAYGHATERQTLEYLCIQNKEIFNLYMTEI